MSKKRSLILQCVIGGLTGVFGTLFLYYVLDAKGQDGFQDVDSTVVLMMLWPVIVWHELGHAISGWLVGFRLYLLAAGPLRVERVGRRLKWRFNRSVEMWGGVAASMPDASNIDGRLRVKVLRMVAGGPVASLAGGLLAVTAAMLWTESPNGSAAFTTFAVLSVLIGVLTLFPISNYGFVNDGQRILQLWRQDAAGMRWMANVTLSSLASSVRPREWPAELAEQDAEGETYDGVMAICLRYSWHLDRNEYGEARSWLERALGHLDVLPAPVRPTIHVIAADFYSRIEPEVERAREHLREASKPGMVSKGAFELAGASVSLAEGKREAALEAVKRGRAVLDALTGSSRESMVEILDAIEAGARR